MDSGAAPLGTTGSRTMLILSDSKIMLLNINNIEHDSVNFEYDISETYLCYGPFGSRLTVYMWLTLTCASQKWFERRPTLPIPLSPRTV